MPSKGILPSAHKPTLFHTRLASRHHPSKGQDNAQSDHHPGLGLRDVPRRLPRGLGSGQPGTSHPGAAGRLADSERNLHHRRWCDHHRCRRLLRHARHILAAFLGGDASVFANTDSEGYRRVPGEDRREDEPAHARVRDGRLRLRHSDRMRRLLRLPHRGRKRDAAGHGSSAPFLARGILATFRHEAGGVRPAALRPPLRANTTSVHHAERTCGNRRDGASPREAQP